jgi:2-dehydro-3-deoxygalactonokinase
LRSGATLLGDWGTSRLRLFHVVEGTITGRASGAGIGAFDRSPAQTLNETIAALGDIGPIAGIALCGMVGSRNGLVEVPYALCPIDLAGWRAAAVPVAMDLPVTIAPGLACVRPDGAPDVMRGEETQVFGALALAPELATGRHLIGLPGTHGKWVVVEDGTVQHFRTYLTGELYALLQEHSTLTRAGSDSAADAGDAHHAGFDAGLARALDGSDLLGALFEARSAQLRSGASHGWALGFLSGLLIGHEVHEGAASAAAVTLIGDPALTALYARALDACGISSVALSGDACSLAGLGLLHSPGVSA